MRVCWQHDGTRVLTGNSEGKVHCFSAEDGALAATMEAHVEEEVYGLEPLCDGCMIAAGAGNTVQQWDLGRAARVAEVSLSICNEVGIVFGGPNRNPEGKVCVFGLAARSRLLWAALSDGTVRLFDAKTLKVAGALTAHARLGAAAFCVAISPTSTRLASADMEGTVLLWDVRQLGKGPIAESDHHEGTVHSVDFISGGPATELLVTGGADRRLRLHETRTAFLNVEVSVCMPSEVLCVKAAPRVAPAAATARLATAGGSGGLMSDAGVSLWRLEASRAAGAANCAAVARATEKRRREPNGPPLPA